MLPIPTPIASVCCSAVINQAAPPRFCCWHHDGGAMSLSRGRVLQPATTDVELLAELLVAEK